METTTMETTTDINRTMTARVLREYGFREYQYLGAKDPVTGKFLVLEDPGRLVYRSVEIHRHIASDREPGYDEMVVSLDPTRGWMGRYGAVRYAIADTAALRRLMVLFGYAKGDGNL